MKCTCLDISRVQCAIIGWDLNILKRLSAVPLLQDLDDIEDENEQLKQENKTLLKVVGQLTR